MLLLKFADAVVHFFQIPYGVGVPHGTASEGWESVAV